MPATFQDIFKSNNVARDKFIARLFGIFGEEIIRCWSKDEKSPYEDLGRPTVKLKGSQGRGSTLDFTLRSKNDGLVYIAEMKCWLEYQNYRFMPLRRPEQLKEANNRAFQLFLMGAKEPSQIAVTVNGMPQSINGSILVWCGCSEQIRAATKAEYNLRDVLSLEQIIADLVTHQNKDFLNLLQDRQAWTEHLFSGLRKIDRACW
jgi:hypothetical protein